MMMEEHSYRVYVIRLLFFFHKSSPFFFFSLSIGGHYFFVLLSKNVRDLMINAVLFFFFLPFFPFFRILKSFLFYFRKYISFTSLGLTSFFHHGCCKQA